MDDDRIRKAIVHYQRNLEKYIDRRDETKMIYCMEKLQRLPITVSHLEHTGVGRTVNSVRKMKGIKGSPKNTAKQLVQQWKKLVTEEENDSEEEESGHDEEDDDEDEEDDDEDDSEDRLQIYCENDDIKDEHLKEEETRNIKMHDSSHYDDEKHAKYNGYSADKYCDSDRLDNEDFNQEEITETRTVKHTTPDCSYDEYQEFYTRENKHIDSNEVMEENMKDQEEEIIGKDATRHEKTDRHDKHKKSSREHLVEKDRDYKDKSKDRDKVKEKHKSRDKEKERDQEKDREKENHHLNGHRKSSSSSNNHDKHKERSERHSSSSRSSKPTSSSNKEREKEGKESINKEHSDKDKDQSKTKDRSSRDKSRESKKITTPPITPTASSSKKRPQEDHKSSSLSSSSSSKKAKLSIHDGIDCESGASFAEALGMMMPSTSKPKKDEKEKSHKEVKEPKEKDSKEKRHSKDHKSTNKDKHRSKDRERSEHKHSKKEKSSTSVKDDKPNPSSGLSIPPPPKLAPIDDVAMANLLPQISTHYKPLGFLPGEGHRSGAMKASDDEMLSKLMYAKNQRTKVYSGNKVLYGKIPTLFELCIRLLQDNIDSLVLGFTGGVPFTILKPVLERATPSQLFSMEHYNSYLMDDTDNLWKLHCQKEFKTKQRNEMETWREMYLRCIDERDAKLKSLTANIKLSQDKSLPVRQTKLAYVDTMCKPPRGVARKQAKNGISNSRPSVTPSSRLSQLAMAGGADKVSVPNPGSTRVNAGNTSSSGPSGGNNYVVKPKKAPLMAKTLQLMKGRFGRR